MLKTKSPATCRFRKMPNGILRIHDVERNIYHEVLPIEIKEKHNDNVSMVIKNYSSKLSKQDLLKLAKKIEEFDLIHSQDWNATYQFIDTCSH